MDFGRQYLAARLPLVGNDVPSGRYQFERLCVFRIRQLGSAIAAFSASCRKAMCLLTQLSDILRRLPFGQYLANFGTSHPTI